MDMQSGEALEVWEPQKLLLARMFTVHLGVGLQDVILAYGPHPKQPSCHGSKWDPGL